MLAMLCGWHGLQRAEGRNVYFGYHTEVAGQTPLCRSRGALRGQQGEAITCYSKGTVSILFSFDAKGINLSRLTKAGG